MTWTPIIVAAIACVIYMAISGYTDNFFPFSRYALYASAPNRNQGAVPIFLANGEQARPSGYERFTGLDHTALYPKGTPCSLEWMVHEATRYLGKHQGDPEDPGPVEVQWGFIWITLEEDGSVTHELRVLQEGHAWPRR